MLLLQADGGVHAGVHCAREGEVPGPLDLRALCRGGQGRGIQIAERGYRDRRGGEAAHEVLRAVQVVESSEQSRRGPDLGHEAASPADSGFSEEERFRGLSTSRPLQKLLRHNAG